MDRREALRNLSLLPAAIASAGVMGSAAQATTGAKPTNTKVPDHGRTIRINGAELFYSIAGEQNEHPMIVLHGGRGQGQHGGVFKALAPLSDRYRVIGFDMRGHGHSSVTGPFTFDQIVDDIEQLRLTLGGGRKLVLQGGSFGGMIALSYAVKYPDGLSHLILRGTTPTYRHEEEAMANFRARAATQAPAATEAMLQKIFTPGIIDDEEFRMIMFALSPLYLAEGVKANYDDILEKSRTGIYRAHVHNALYEPTMWHAYDLVDKLPDIKVPTFIICGEKDWICDVSQSRLMAAKIPGSKLVVVPGYDHAIPADIVLRETRAFLDEA